MRKIQSNLIDTLDFSSISDISSIPVSKRVINIPNCPTVNSVLDFLTSNATNLPTHLLVFIFNIQEPKNLIFERQKLQNLSESLKSQETERIFVFQSKFRPTKLLCKIKNQALLTKFELNRNHRGEDEFPNVSIANEMIFKAVVLSRVEYGICGVYDYSFLDITLDINRNFFGIKLVDYALINFDSLSLKFFQLFGIDLSLTNENGDRPLETAAKCGNFCGFLELLGSSFDLLTLLHQPTGYNLLLLAAENGSLEILRFLLELDIFDVNYCVNGQTALKLAMNEKKVEAVEILLEHDARYDEKTNETFTQDVKELHRLVRSERVSHENWEQIKKTLQKYPKTHNFFDSKGQSIIGTAVSEAIKEINERKCSTEPRKVEQTWSNFIEFLLISGLRMGKSEEFPEILTSKLTANPLYCDYVQKIMTSCVIKYDSRNLSQQCDINQESKGQFDTLEKSMDMTSNDIDENRAKMVTDEESIMKEEPSTNIVEFEVNSTKDDKNSDGNSNDGSDFKLVDNSDTEIFTDRHQLNTKENGHKMLIDALKMLNGVPETKILLEIFGLYENIKIVVNLSSLSLEIKENCPNFKVISSNTSTVDDSSSEFSFFSCQSNNSYDLNYSSASTSFEELNDDIKSIYSLTSETTLRITSSFENLKTNNENFCKNSEKFGNFKANFPQILIEKIFNFVIEKVFANIFKPYFQNDKKSKKNLNKIAKKIRKIVKNGKIKENFVNNIFYTKNNQHWHQLLVALVPKFCAIYAKNEEKLLENREKFKILFDFYQNLIVELKSHIKTLKLSGKVAKLNKFSKTFEKVSKASENFVWNNSKKFNDLKIFGNKVENDDDFCLINLEELSHDSLKFPQIFLTNSSTLTMCQIFQEKRENFVIFVNFEIFSSEIFQFEVRDLLRHAYLVVEVDLPTRLTKNLQNFEVMSKYSDRILFVLEQNDSKLKENPKNSKKIENFCLKNFNIRNIFHIFSDFDRKTKEFLLKKQVDLQGKKVKLSDIIMTSLCPILNEIPLSILIDDSEPLKIGQKFENLDKFYYDRRFIDTVWDQMSAIEDQRLYVDPVKCFEDLTVQNLVLLCDEPGMGKTTTLKQLQFKFKDLFPSNWIFYVDLKLYAPIYEDFKDIQDWNYENYSKFFTKIQNLSELESKIFHQLLLTKKVVFLIDSVDEITQKHRDFIIKFTKDLHEITKCHLWIAMRPHCRTEYSGNLHICSYHLEPLHTSKFIESFIKSQNMPENEEKKPNVKSEHEVRSSNSEENAKNRYLSCIKNHQISFNNPLLIGIAIDVCDHFNDSVGTYMMYETFVLKKFSIASGHEMEEQKDEKDEKIVENLGKLETSAAVKNSSVVGKLENGKNFGKVENFERLENSENVENLRKVENYAAVKNSAAVENSENLENTKSCPQLFKSIEISAQTRQIFQNHQKAAIYKFALATSNKTEVSSLEILQNPPTEAEIASLIDYEIISAVDTIDQIDFIHKTFYEFFVASFVIKMIFEEPKEGFGSSHVESCGLLLANVFKDVNNHVIGRFIESYVDSNMENLTNCENLKIILSKTQLFGGKSSKNLFEENLVHLITSKFFIFVDLVLKIFKNEAEMSEIFTKTAEKSETIFTKIVKFSNSGSEILEFLKFFVNIFNISQRKLIFEEILYFEGEIGSKKSRIFAVIFNRLNLNELENFFGILRRVFNQNELESHLNKPEETNIFDLIIDNIENFKISSKKLEMFLDFSKKFIEIDKIISSIVKIFDKENCEILELILKKMLSTLTINEILQTLKHENGKVAIKILNLMSTNFCDELYERLVNKLRENLNTKIIRHYVASEPNLKVHFFNACRNFHEKKIEIFWNFAVNYLEKSQLREFLTFTPENSEFSTFHFAISNFVINFDNFFTNCEMKSLLSTRNSKNETILFEIYKKNQLNWSVEKLLFEVFKLSELAKFLNHRNNSGHSAFNFDGCQTYFKFKISSVLASFINENFPKQEIFIVRQNNKTCQIL